MRKLVLQGAEDGIEGIRDGFVLSASGGRVAFIVFGACAALVDTSQPQKE